LKLIHLWAISTMLLVAGCAETQFAREEKSAERQIDVAKDEGASPEALEAARGSLKFARESETRATNDLAGGREDLKKAQDRQQAARAVSNEKRAASEGADAKVFAAEQDAIRVAERQSDLRSKGLSETDVSAASGLEMSRAKQRVASTRAARETLVLEIPLAGLECDAAQTAIKAAETRISSAEQRLNVARSLYARSEQQAKGVEMEALAGKRDAIDTRLNKN
jgi:hypothetical protein